MIGDNRDDLGAALAMALHGALQLDGLAELGPEEGRRYDQNNDRRFVQLAPDLRVPFVARHDLVVGPDAQLPLMTKPAQMLLQSIAPRPVLVRV